MMRGRQIWASKFVATLERPLDLDQKYGLLEINPKLFGSLTQSQNENVFVLNNFYRERQKETSNQIIQEILNLLSVFGSMATENVLLTRKFLLEKTTELTGNYLLADTALKFYESQFQVSYASALNPEFADEFDRFYKVATDLTKKENTNIYALADAYLKVFPENKEWLKETPRPTFMRVVPTRLGSVFPFAEVENPREPVENYFRFRKQVNHSLNSMQLNKKINSEKTGQYVEFISRVHLAMIYYHFFEELNGRFSRVMMNFLNIRNGFLPMILNTDSKSIDSYKLSNQIGLVTGRTNKWGYEADVYWQFAQLTINWVIVQQIRAEKLYLNLKKLFS